MEEEEYTVPAIQDMEDIDLIYHLINKLASLLNKAGLDEYDQVELKYVQDALWTRAKYL